MLPIEFKDTEWFEKHIKPDMKIFEYGSGSSTAYFASKVSQVVSVECYPERYNKNQNMINSSVHYKLIEPIKDSKPFPYSHESYGSVDDEFAHFSFENYVNYIKEYSDRFFDIILINGRARASCIRAAVPKTKLGGYIILNDSERYVYQNAIELFLKEYPHQKFGEGVRKTGIWEIKQL